MTDGQKFAVNAAASFAVAIISVTIIFDLFIIQEAYLLIGFGCASLHLLFSKSLSKMDFLIQIISIAMFVVIVAAVRLLVMGL